MVTIKNILTLNLEIDCSSEKDIYEKLDLLIQFLLKNKLTGSVHIYLNKKEYQFDDDEEGV